MRFPLRASSALEGSLPAPQKFEPPTGGSSNQGSHLLTQPDLQPRFNRASSLAAFCQATELGRYSKRQPDSVSDPDLRPVES
jgi:hypothetical protein